MDEEYFLENREGYSFCGKAVVRDYGRRKDLYSYGANVCTITDGKAEIYLDGNSGHYLTSLNHVQEFLAQNNIA